MSYEKPYKGIRVVDMAQAVAGPYCGSILARLGADVIKVEPERGDLSRGAGTVYDNDHTVLSLFANLGKRSVCVDLKTEGGAGVVRRLLETADIFIESFRPGVTKRLGFAYEAVKKINPNIIYLSVSGFGQQGPFAERPGTDMVLQAFSGFMGDNKGFDGLPHRNNVILIDMAAALYNVQAIQAALWVRQNEEEGCYIENSLLETAAAFQNVNLISQVLTSGSATPPVYPLGTYQCADGYVQLSVLFEREFKPFMDMLGLGDLAEDERLNGVVSRYEHRHLIDQPIKDIVARYTTAELCEKLRELRMLHERLNTYDDFMHHEQTEQMAALFWQDYPGMGKVPIANIPGIEKFGTDLSTMHSPTLGEHTAEVLAEAGYSEQDIQALAAAQAIKLNAA